MAILVQSNKKPNLTFPTLTGSIVTFNSQYAGLPLKSHKIALTATQSGSGTPSPDNVRTINGYSDINITATGKNFLRNTYAGGTPYGLSIVTNADGSMTFNGTPSSDYNGQMIGYFTLPAGTYIYTDARPENSKCYTYLLIEGSGIWYTDGMTFMVDGNTRTRIILYFQVGNNYDFTIYPMIRSSSIADSTFEPFGTTTTITIGSTVYGGEYDARTGLLTVTHIYKQYDKNSPWEVGTGNAHIFIAAESDYPYGTKINGMSNYFKPAYTAENSVWLIYRQFHVRPDSTICPSGTTTAEGLNEFKTWLADGNKIIQYVQPLDEPITIQLPPCPIDTLEVNNIWADTGDTTLQYPKFG